MSKDQGCAADHQLKGVVGRHEWVLGDVCKEGVPVFVDDRQLGYSRTTEAAKIRALDMIARLQADGDYRLNDKPAGYLPPSILGVSGKEVGKEARCPGCGDSGDVTRADGEWICECPCGINQAHQAA